jgi:hypothetical protein
MQRLKAKYRPVHETHDVVLDITNGPTLAIPKGSSKAQTIKVIQETVEEWIKVSTIETKKIIVISIVISFVFGVFLGHLL